MESYGYVRCLFCTTGREENVVQMVHEKHLGRAIFPQRVRTMLWAQRWEQRLVPLLPGYVFVYSDQEGLRYDEYRSMKHVLRVLDYGDGKDTLTGRDLEFADWIWRLDGRIGAIKAVQVGDRIEIVDGVLKQLRGTVTRMDRRRKTIRVALDSAGLLRQIWLSYEIVEKLDENGELKKKQVGATT